MRNLTIAGLATAVGVGVETVRYYQRRGLLATPLRPERGGLGGGIRRYGQDEVRRLRFIRVAQNAGFTLEEIGDLLALDSTDDRSKANMLAKARIAALDARIVHLTEAREALTRLVAACSDGTKGPCPILTAFEGKLCREPALQSLDNGGEQVAG